ncbi:MAG: carbon-nitrogen hydrolase family protein [Lachnospiraceae bacterium]|nr:carbon-nitrogen hydrolase family protein [Lachnospiraceae bacterium]
MKHVINIAVVNFYAEWGNKENNLARILDYTEAAGKRGADMLVMPETCLTGYMDEEGKSRTEKMHARLAETIPGPSTEKVAELARKYGMFVVFGMSEKDPADETKIYNSAAIIHPDGKMEAYRKLHLPFAEGNWAVVGDEPVLIDTPWGPVGITICYDTYCFPELIRYYRAKGARLTLNCTACPDGNCTAGSAELAIPAYAFGNYIFIASSNLVGNDHGAHFMGGSGVVGPAIDKGGVHTYVGHMFKDPNSDQAEMYLGTIDLSMADVNTDIPLFRGDWRPELYKKMCEDVLAN